MIIYRYLELDKAVQEMIASLSTSSDDNDTTAVNDITHCVTEERETLRILTRDHAILNSNHHELVQQHGVIKTTHEGCQKRFDEINTKHSNTQKQVTAKLDETQKALASSQTKRNQLQKQVDCLQGMFGDNIRCLEHDLAKATRELKEKRVGYDEAIRERNNTRKEMFEVKERIRKLLFSLGLNNDIGKTGQSLEHARNITYAMRRNANNAATTAQQKPGSLSDLKPAEMETLTDLFQTVVLPQRSGVVSSRSSTTGNNDKLDKLSVRSQLQTAGSTDKSPRSSSEIRIPSSTPPCTTSSEQVNSPPTQNSRPETETLNVEQSTSPEELPLHTDRCRPKSVVTDKRRERRSSSAGLVDRRPVVTAVVEQDKSRPSSDGGTHPESALRTTTIGQPGTDLLSLATKSSESGIGSLTSTNTSTQSPQTGSARNVRCSVCDKSFIKESNYEGACIHHVSGATKLYEGTGLEVWSCCKTSETLKGCQRSKHIAISV